MADKMRYFYFQLKYCFQCYDSSLDFGPVKFLPQNWFKCYRIGDNLSKTVSIFPRTENSGRINFKFSSNQSSQNKAAATL